MLEALLASPPSLTTGSPPLSRSIKRLTTVALHSPHSAYTGLVSCLSAKWQYICRAIPDIGPLISLVEEALRI
ncbi:hypothetical protein ACHAW6_003094 [Cyclotella cf. meneghiniana]